MSKDYSSAFSGLNIHAVGPRKNQRTQDLLIAVVDTYRQMKQKLKPHQSIDLLCLVGGASFSVAKIAQYGENALYFTTVENEGASEMIFCTIEQAAFSISISKKTDDKPPRDIGFKSIMDQAKV